MRFDATYLVLGALIALAVVGVVITKRSGAWQDEVQVVHEPPAASALARERAAAPLDGSSGKVGVYISGAVLHPGVYMVGEGSRLAHVVLLAGGATADADLTAVNLAALVRDEEHWHIPDVEEAAAGVSASGDGVRKDGGAASGVGAVSGDGEDGKIDLNSADVELLKTLPGVGDVKAQAIVSYREANGDFASVDGLLEVSGIGFGTLDNIRELVVAE